MGFRNPITTAVDLVARQAADQAGQDAAHALTQIIPGSRLAADAIDGKTITGATISGATIIGSLIRAVGTGDAYATSVGHALQAGPTNGPNVAIDGNEILARISGAVAPLFFTNPRVMPDSEALATAPGNALVSKDFLQQAGAPVLNVAAYGAKGDDATLNDAAIATALAACPEGGEVVFPVGTYRISRPILLKRNRTISGTHAGRWPYDTGGPCRIKADPTFSGAALVLLQDEEILFGSVGAAANGLQVGPNDQCGMRLRRLTLDGFSVGTDVDGVQAHGLVRDVRLEEVAIRRVTGTGVHTTVYARRSDGFNHYPRGWSMRGVTADTCGNNGFGLNLLNDSTLVDCLAVGAANHGFYLAGTGELQLIGCRSVFNKNGHGYWITGSTYGNTLLSACSTDRNQLHGVYIDATGHQPVLLSGVTLRRDGGNSNGGGAALAGLCVSNSSAPVVVDGITTETGVDDAGAGAWTPQYGMRVLNSTSVVVSSGVLWGQAAAYSDAGGNTNLRVSNLVVQATGTTSSPAFTYTP